MAQPYKEKKVQVITERLKDAKSIVVIDYKGINIEEVNQLRDRMRKADVDYFVSKNTFIKIALNDLGVEDLNDKLEGPTAIAISKVDEVSPARELALFKKEVMADKEFPTFKAGYIDGKLVDIETLEKYAKLPSKEVLLTKILYGFNAPITNFVGVLNGIVRQVVTVVDAIAKKQAEEN